MIVIFFLILLVVYFLNCNKDNFHKDNFHEDIRGKYKPKKNIDYLDELVKYTNSKQELYDDMEFVEGQFHNDYRDTITAFNNIAPSQKQVFNINNDPAKFSNPSQKEVNKLIKDFITELNKNVMEVVPDYRQPNTGWDEALPDPQVKSGWEKAQEELGLPKSVYPDPAKKSKVSIVKVDHLEKYETDEEIKYTCYLFLKKKNVKDIIVVKVSFVINKDVLNDVVIEDIFMLGYMTEVGVGRNTDNKDNFYNFNNLEYSDMLDDRQIMKQLNNKLAVRHRDMQKFNNSLEPQFKKIKSDAPNLSNYRSYQATQTIFDDLNLPRYYS